LCARSCDLRERSNAKVSEAVWEYSESESKMTSNERRLQRFVDNDRIHVNESWKALMEQVLLIGEEKQ